jgi:hypothetical protein
MDQEKVKFPLHKPCGEWKNRNFCSTHNCSLYVFWERTPLLLFCHWSFGIRLVGYSQIYNTHASAHPQTHNNITQQLWSKCDLSTNNQSFLLSVKITSVAPCMTQCIADKLLLILIFLDLAVKTVLRNWVKKM